MVSDEMASLVPPGLEGKEDVLFGNLNELYSFHNDTFLKDLETCISTTELVALCFVQRVRTSVKSTNVSIRLAKSQRIVLFPIYSRCNFVVCIAFFVLFSQLVMSKITTTVNIYLEFCYSEKRNLQREL